jgi:hypothetical protein
MTKGDLADVLQSAVQENFCKLFGVLMADPTDKGLSRFRLGLTNLAKMEEAVARIIEEEE